MNAELIVWLVSLLSVFLVGWAWGRSTRPRVHVHFPEMPSLTALRPTPSEVRTAMRKTADEDES